MLDDFGLGRIRIVPGPGGSEAVAISSTHHCLDDIQALHFRKAGCSVSGSILEPYCLFR